jgi:hypothetical protein
MHVFLKVSLNVRGLMFRTPNTSLNAFSIEHTGSQSPENYGGLHTFQVKGDRQNTILMM